MDAYAEYSSLLRNEGSDDLPTVYQGLIYALIANGYDAGSRELRTKVASLLNGGEGLPGSMIAMLTDLAVDAGEALKQGKPQFLMPGEQKDRLQALAGLAYGTALGLPFKADGTTFEDHSLMEEVMTLNDIGRVDDEGDFSEEDFKVIVDYIATALTKAYRRAHS